MSFARTKSTLYGTCVFASMMCIAFLFIPPPQMAYAEDVPLPVADPGGDLFVQLLRAVMSGDWLYVAGAVLVLSVYLLRRYVTPLLPQHPLAKRFPNAAAMLLTVFASFLGAVGTAFLAGAAPSVALFETALKVAFVAGGGFAMAKSALKEVLPGVHDAVFPKKPEPVVGSSLGSGPA